MGNNEDLQNAPKEGTGFFSKLKGKVVIVTAIIAGVAALLKNIDSIIDFFSPKIEHYSIKGVVFNSNNIPTDFAKVSLYVWSDKLLDSFSTSSDKTGSFIFPDLQVKKYDSIKLVAVWKSKYVLFQDKFGSNSTKNSISLVFPRTARAASENPLVYNFYWLKGHAIDYLLQGKIDSSWESLLSKHPYIIKNKVFEAISYIQSEFSEKNYFPETTRNIVYNKNSKRKTGLVPAKQVLKNLITGTVEYHDPELIGVVNAAQIIFTKEDITSILGSKYVSTILNNSSEANHLILTKQQFDKVVAKSALYEDRSKIFDLLEFFTKNNFPDRFIEAEVAYSDCAGGFVFQLLPPALSLQVVLIEGKDKSKVYSLGNFTISESSDTLLKLLNNTEINNKVVEQNYFPSIKMSSDEKILIPLRILLKTYSGKIYVYGHSDSLVSQNIDEEEFLIRKQPQTVVYIHDSGEGGSCPYVFSRDNGKSEWLLESHILYGVNSKAKETQQALKLKRFDGKLELREMDPETSYIDEIFVKNTLPNGTTEILYPDNSLLGKRDGNYLIMKRGDRLQLDFHAKKELKGTFEIVAFGYYVRNPK